MSLPSKKTFCKQRQFVLCRHKLDNGVRTCNQLQLELKQEIAYKKTYYFPILSGILHIIKSILRPIRKLYINFLPEIYLSRCLMFQPSPFRLFNYLNQSEGRMKTANTKQIIEEFNFDKFSTRIFLKNNILGTIKNIYFFINELKFLIRTKYGIGCYLDYFKERLFIWLDYG